MTRWARFIHAGLPTLGRVEGDNIDVYSGEPWADAQPTGETVPLDGLVWLPPCVPGKIIGLWNNFRAAADKNGWAHPAEPLYFLKSPDCVAAHGQEVEAVAADVGRVAYEGELAVVIGAPAYRLAVHDVPACILGYAIANDMTAIELLGRDPGFVQWTRAKSFPGFGAFGPWIDTDFDPATASLRTVVGGRERQNYAFADMFFPPVELVWRLSQDMKLLPGDVILCGTSLGILPMKPGTNVDVIVDGLGTLSNRYGAAG